MKTMNNSTTALAKPRALRRQPDRSLFANGDSGVLLYFEDPAALAFIRTAVNAAFQPASDFELLLAEQLVRIFWRATRNGNLETAAIDVELADHQEAIESRWGKIDPESLYHLATREPATRSAIREYANVEGAAMRRFNQALHLLKAMKKSS